MSVSDVLKVVEGQCHCRSLACTSGKISQHGQIPLTS